MMRDKDAYHKMLRKGMLVCYFYSGDPNISFDDEVRSYYKEISADNTRAVSRAVIYVAYDANSFTSEARAEQLKEGVLTTTRQVSSIH